MSRLSPLGPDLIDPTGNVVALRGCNLGNWFLIESWMLGVDSEVIPDHHTFVQTLTQRFGRVEALRLMDVHYAHWITPADLERVRGFNFNAVRLPFYFELVEPRRGEYDFRWLDHAIALCRDAGLYVILDLHGAPGGQSIDQPCGRVDSNELWSSPAYQQQTVDLWIKIAKRYANEPAVAAYDLLNEPYGDLRQDLRPQVLALMERLVPAVRLVDPDTLIYLPGTLQGIDFYGPPRDRGWIGVGFTEHAYPGLFGSETSVASHLAYLGPSFEEKRALMTEWDSPYLLGEFNPVFERVGGARLLRRYFERAAEAGWAATMWSYKILNAEGGMPADNWPLVTNAEPLETLDLLQDSAAEIEAKLKHYGSMQIAVDEVFRREMQSPEPLPVWTYPEPDVLPGAIDTLPPPWEDMNVGGAAPGGQTADGNGRWTFYGGGRDIFGQEDQFRFIAQSADGDFRAWLVVDDLDAVARYAKFGWMWRESAAPDAAHRLLHVFTNGQIVWAGRDVATGQTHEQVVGTARLPIGIGLERRGDTLIAHATDIRGRWRILREEALPTGLRGPGLVGTAVSANSAGGLAVMSASHWRFGGSAPRVSPSKGANLLDNGSFEAPADASQFEDSNAAAWFTWGQGLNRQTGWSPRLEGNCMLGYHHWELSDSGSAGMWQDVGGMTPGREYEFSVAVARDLPDAGSREAESIELRLESPSARAGEHLTLATRTYEVADLESGEAWNPLTVSAIAPGTTLRVLVAINPAAEGPRGAALKFDAARLVAERE